MAKYVLRFGHLGYPDGQEIELHAAIPVWATSLERAIATAAQTVARHCPVGVWQFVDVDRAECAAEIPDCEEGCNLMPGHDGDHDWVPF